MRFLEPLVVTALKIPPPPQPPEGHPGSLARFRPATGYYRYLLLQWAVRQLGALAGLGVTVVFLHSNPLDTSDGLGVMLYALEAFGVAIFLLQSVTTLATLSLRYRMRWYLVSDRALRIREGVVSTHEQTMSFANIQNIEVEQGPLQRLFGIADHVVTTAGGGGGASDAHKGLRNLHRAYFRGVDDPDRIRALILDRQSSLRDAGLGDDDDEGPATEQAMIEAARDLTAAARALRAA